MHKIKEVQFFVDKNEKNHVAKWLKKLDVKTRARINLRLVRLEYGSYGDYKSIAKNFMSFGSSLQMVIGFISLNIMTRLLFFYAQEVKIHSIRI